MCIANGLDGLQQTRRWLAATCEQVMRTNRSALEAASSESSPAAAGGAASASLSPPTAAADTPASPRSPRAGHSLVLNAAYLRLLEDSWDYESDQCPEVKCTVAGRLRCRGDCNYIRSRKSEH